LAPEGLFRCDVTYIKIDIPEKVNKEAKMMI
jgi:hypothetical protein